MCPNNQLPPNLAYFIMVCSLSLKEWKKLDKWRKKEKVAALKNYLQQMNVLKKNSKTPAKTWIENREMHLTLQLIDLQFTESSLEMDSAQGWLPRSWETGRKAEAWQVAQEPNWKGQKVWLSDESKCDKFLVWIVINHYAGGIVRTFAQY